MSKLGAVDEELPMPTMQGSTVLRRVADSAGASAVVAIGSLSGTIQHVTVSCLMERGTATNHVFDLLPNQTLLAKPCMPDHGGPVLSASDFAGAPERLGDAGAGRGATAFSITTDGMPGELAAMGSCHTPVKKTLSLPP